MSDSRMRNEPTCKVSPSTTRAGPVISADAVAVTNRKAARALLRKRIIPLVCAERGQALITITTPTDFSSIDQWPDRLSNSQWDIEWIDERSHRSPAHLLQPECEPPANPKNLVGEPARYVATGGAAG